MESYLHNLKAEMGRPSEDGFKDLPLEVHLLSMKKSCDRLGDLKKKRADKEKALDDQIRRNAGLDDPEPQPPVMTVASIGR